MVQRTFGVRIVQDGAGITTIPVHPEGHAAFIRAIKASILPTVRKPLICRLLYRFQRKPQ